MTLRIGEREAIEEILSEIRASAHDDEDAHSLEDFLWEKVLRVIAGNVYTGAELSVRVGRVVSVDEVLSMRAEAFRNWRKR